MIRTLAALIAALALAAAGECPDCAVVRNRVTLCRPHKAEEKAQLRAARKALKSADEQARVMAYRDVAVLNAQHVNAPSPAVAELLGEGLDDDDTDVFETCLELLLQGQHPDTLIEVLLDGLDAAEQRCKDNRAGIEKFIGWGRKGGTLHTSPDELAGVTSAMIRRPLIFRALGQLRDPRAYEVLADYLAIKPLEMRGNDARTAAKMLLGYGTAESLQAVLEGLASIRKAARGKYEQDMQGLADEIAGVVEDWARWKAGEDPPGLEPLDEDAWEAWSEAQLAAAPALERLTQPVTAELPGPYDGEEGAPGQDGQAGAAGQDGGDG